MDHVSDLGGIRLCFNGVLTSTSRVGEAMLFVTHFIKKVTQGRLQAGNAPGLVYGMARLGPMSSNKPIHATVKIDIVETMFTQKLIHPGVFPIGAAPRQLNQDPSPDANGMFGNNEKRIPEVPKYLTSALDLGKSLAATFGVILCPLTPPGTRTGKEDGVRRPAGPIDCHFPALGGW